MLSCIAGSVAVCAFGEFSEGLRGVLSSVASFISMSLVAFMVFVEGGDRRDYARSLSVIYGGRQNS